MDILKRKIKIKEKIKWFHSLKFKLILSHLLISYALLFIFSVCSFSAMKNYLTHNNLQTQEIFAHMNLIKQKLFLFAFVSCIIVFIIIFFLCDIFIRPLKKILFVINKIASGELEARINLNKHDEFSQLANSFDNITSKLEHIEAIREEFVSNVSHELKTPLSTIKVLCESLLNEKNLSQEIHKEFLSDINSEIDRMTNIINDLLTLVKFNRKRFPLNLSEINLNNTLENIIKRLTPLACKKNIEIEFTHNKNIILQADEMKFSLAISNLIDNGIKYTQSGGKIKINTDIDEKFIYITIQDNGIGISEQEHEKIFHRFYRVDKTRDRETGGTGLGLSISQSAIIMHHGNITLTSEEGLGTTFTVTMPR